MSDTVIVSSPTVTAITVAQSGVATAVYTAAPAVGPSGPQGTGNQTVATVAGLSTLNDTPLVSGQVALVAAQRSWWVLDKTSVTALNANLVAATQSGTGRWVRQLWAHPSNNAQSAWHVNWGTGDDGNDGLTTGTALKTLREWQRRMAGASPTVAMDIFIDASVLASNGDALTGVLFTNSTGSYFFHGTMTALLTGTITAAAATVPSTNSPYQITGVGLGGQNGNLIRNTTSGARLGMSSWIYKVLSGDNVAICQPENWNTAVLYSGSAGDFLVNDTFEVDSIPIVDFTDLTMRPNHQGSGLVGTICFENLRFRGSFLSNPFAFVTAAVNFRNCFLQTAFFITSGALLVNCNRSGGGPGTGAVMNLYGGLITGGGVVIDINGFEVHHDGTVIYNSQITVRQGRLSIHGSLSSGAVDSATPFVVTYNGQVDLTNHSIWGAGNTGSIFDLNNGGTLCYSPTSTQIYCTRTDQGNAGTADFRFDGRTVSTPVTQADVAGAQVAGTIAALGLGTGAAAVSLESRVCGSRVFPSYAP